MPPHIHAILWAQWRSMRNFRLRGSAGSLAASIVIAVVWYGSWLAGAFAVATLASDPDNRQFIEVALPSVLLLVLSYWQLAPILAVSMGAALDFRKLLVYPVPRSQFFSIEVILRLSSGLEMLLILGGATVGLLRNGAAPRWGPAAFLVYVLFNLFLAAGMRHLVERLIARKRMREIFLLCLVTVIGMPQLLAVTGVPGPLRAVLLGTVQGLWPWSAASNAALGLDPGAAWVMLLTWTAVAYAFGRWQFSHSLDHDIRAPVQAAGSRSRIGRILHVPRLSIPGPLGALLEKELRSLSRTPRFRLVFFMGFTFGLIVFMPVMLHGAHGSRAGVSADFLTLVCAYALLLLGDAGFWNIFGFDRSAAQIYYLLPVPFSWVFAAKNLAALVCVVLEITAIVAVWLLLRMPATAIQIFDAYAVTIAVGLYLVAAGNLSSIYYPRAVNPDKASGAASSARFRALLVLVYPLAAIPVLSAYAARYVSGSQAMFYVTLALAAVLGIVVYVFALGAASASAMERREKLLEELAGQAGPVALG